MAYSKQNGDYIPDGVINRTLQRWHATQPDREQTVASPSTLTECPRVVWLKKHGVNSTSPMGWGIKQRLLLGRITENTIAQQLRDEGILIHHWKDDVAGESDKFEHGEGLDKLAGTPDLLIKIGDEVAISDSKTSRSDSFKYVPINPHEIWQDYLWYKYKLQLTAYYMLCHWNKAWFEERGYPLPTIAHLFSYALDNGIVHRDLEWKPTGEDIEAVVKYTRRWNAGYQSETMPECTCQQVPDNGAIKFCYYGVKPPGSKVCTSCCDVSLVNQVKEENNGNKAA